MKQTWLKHYSQRCIIFKNIANYWKILRNLWLITFSNPQNCTILYGELLDILSTQIVNL